MAAPGDGPPGGMKSAMTARPLHPAQLPIQRSQLFYNEVKVGMRSAAAGGEGDSGVGGRYCVDMSGHGPYTEGDSCFWLDVFAAISWLVKRVNVALFRRLGTDGGWRASGVEGDRGVVWSEEGMEGAGGRVERACMPFATSYFPVASRW